MPRRNNTNTAAAIEADDNDNGNGNEVGERLKEIKERLDAQKGQLDSIQATLEAVNTRVSDPALLLLAQDIHREVVALNAGTLVQQIGRIVQAVLEPENASSPPSLYTMVRETREAVANEGMTRTVLGETGILRSSVGEGEQSVLAKAKAIATVAGEIRKAVADESGTRTVLGETGILRSSVGEGEQSVLAKTKSIHALAEHTNQQVAGNSAETLRAVVTTLRDSVAAHDDDILKRLQKIAQAVGLDANAHTVYELLIQLRDYFNIGATQPWPPPKPY